MTQLARDFSVLWYRGSAYEEEVAEPEAKSEASEGEAKEAAEAQATKESAAPSAAPAAAPTVAPQVYTPEEEMVTPSSFAVLTCLCASSP